MGLQAFNHGPYIIEAGEDSSLGVNYTVRYGEAFVGSKWVWGADTRQDVINELAIIISSHAVELRDENTPGNFFHLMKDGERWATFKSKTLGLEPGLIDDEGKFHIISNNRLRSREVTIEEFAAIVAEHEAPRNAWIASVLPDDVMTLDAEEWRAPTSWEIRHIIGRASFVGITGEKAARLVGIQPQSFRKYLAADGAATRQKISFPIWHLLLHRLGVQNLERAKGFA